MVGVGEFRDWSNDSDVAHFAETGLILVMPAGAASYYTKAVDPPQDRYEDYIVKDLVADVEAKLPSGNRSIEPRDRRHFNGGVEQ